MTCFFKEVRWKVVELMVHVPYPTWAKKDKAIPVTGREGP
jgi:hypothetical protein